MCAWVGRLGSPFYTRVELQSAGIFHALQSLPQRLVESFRKPHKASKAPTRAAAAKRPKGMAEL